MAIEAAWSRFEQLLARHPDMPFELELLLVQLAAACARIERDKAKLVESVADVADEDLRAVLGDYGVEHSWTAAGALELWHDGRLIARSPLEG